MANEYPQFAELERRQRTASHEEDTVRLLAFALLTLCSCETNPVTGRQQLMLVSEDMAITESKEAYAAMLQPLEKKGQIDNNPAVSARVRTITGRLIAQAIKYRPETQSWEWSVKVIDEPKTVNAWCMAGGRMAIYTGLIDQLKATDDELAQVMGHEISHALAKHTAERMSRAMAMQMGLGVLAATQQSSRYGDLTLTGAQLAAVVALELPNSREAETEADRIGIELAAKAGYDPKAAMTLWDKMAKVGGGRQFQLRFSLHPPGAAEAHGNARRAGAADDAVLPGQDPAPGLSDPLRVRRDGLRSP